MLIAGLAAWADLRRGLMANLIWVRAYSCLPKSLCSLILHALLTESWDLPRQETFGVDRDQRVGYEACFYVDYEGKLVRVDSATCGYTKRDMNKNGTGAYKAPQFP